MTKILKQVREAFGVETSKTTSSGVEVTVTSDGAVRVEPADVMKYESAKDQIAAARKAVSKSTSKK